MTIMNFNQYNITQEQVRRFQEALVLLESAFLDATEETHQILLKAEMDGIYSVKNDLVKELLEYEKENN